MTWFGLTMGVCVCVCVCGSTLTYGHKLQVLTFTMRLRIQMVGMSFCSRVAKRYGDNFSHPGGTRRAAAPSH